MNNTVEKTERSPSTASSEERKLDIPLPELWRGLRKFWWLCLLLMLLGAAFMFYRSYIHFTPVYQCSATFTVQTQQIGSAGDGITSYSFTYNRSTATQLSNTFPSIMQSNILQDIIKNDLEVPYMPATLSASNVSGTNMFTITAKGSHPQLTYDTLQSAIRNYPAVAEYVIGNTNLYMLSEPILPTEPTNRLAYRSQVVLGALMGLAMGCAWIVLYAMCRSTIRSRRDIREKLNQHCLGVLPQVIFRRHNKEIDRSVLLTNPMLGDGYMESCRSIRNAIIHNGSEDQKVIMITSTAPGEGKTTTAVNLAISLSRMDLRVLLVDADLRNPSINETVGLPTHTAYEKKPAFAFSALPGTSVTVMNFNTDAHKFWQLIRVPYLTELFHNLRTRYDYIIVDTSPCGLTSEPAIIAQAVDAAILVIRQDTVRISRITDCLSTQLLEHVKLLGCILNGASEGISGYGYGYSHYGYGYGYGYGNKYGEKAGSPLSHYFRRKNPQEEEGGAAARPESSPAETAESGSAAPPDA